MKTIKIKINYKKAKIEVFIFNSTMVKADIFLVKEKNKVINKKDDIRIFFLNFFLSFQFERFYVL